MAVAGKIGKLTLLNPTTSESEKVIGLKNWSLSLTVTSLDTTALGDSWKSYILGLKEWTASASGFFEIVGSPATGEITQNDLQEALLNGTQVSVQFYVDETHYYAGNAVVTSITIDDTLEDVISASFEFSGCGALSFS